MKHNRAVMIVLAGLLSAATAVAQEAKPAGSATRPSSRPARLDQLIQTIRETDNPGTAVAAYARATAIDPNSGELQNTYMRRMLQLGLPQIAHYPAQVLVAAEPNNALAWGVVGYMQGKRGDWAAALAATARALDKTPYDPSLLNNAGQLIAWYEGQPDIPKLPDAARRIIDNSVDRWAKDDNFTKAYRKVASLFEDQARQDKDLKTKVEQARKDVRAAREAVAALQHKLTDIDGQISFHQDQLDDLRHDYWLVNWYPTTVVRDAQGHIIAVGGTVDPRRRDDLLAAIRDEERVLDALRAEREKVVRNGQAAVDDLRRRQEDLDALQQQTRAVNSRLERLFRWDPPAVNGVVTPELDRFPAAPAKTLPSEPETDARQKLELARLYLVNDMQKKAADLLKEIIAKYPETPSASQARELLSKIPE